MPFSYIHDIDWSRFCAYPFNRQPAEGIYNGAIEGMCIQTSADFIRLVSFQDMRIVLEEQISGAVTQISAELDVESSVADLVDSNGVVRGKIEYNAGNAVECNVAEAVDIYVLPICLTALPSRVTTVNGIAGPVVTFPSSSTFVSGAEGDNTLTFSVPLISLASVVKALCVEVWASSKIQAESNGSQLLLSYSGSSLEKTCGRTKLLEAAGSLPTQQTNPVPSSTESIPAVLVYSLQLDITKNAGYFGLSNVLNPYSRSRLRISASGDNTVKLELLG